MLINILFEFLLYFQPFFLKQSFFLLFFFGYNQSKPYICDVHNKTEVVKLLLAYIIHSGFISGYQNRYGDNLKPPTNVYHRMTA